MASEPENEASPPGGQVLIYRDGATRLQVRLDGQTVWITQTQMAELFQTTVPNVSIHIRNFLAEGELGPEATIKEYLIVRQEGSRLGHRHCHEFEGAWVW